MSTTLTFSEEIFKQIKLNASLSDQDGSFPWEEFKALRQAGLLSAPLNINSGRFDSRKTFDNLKLLQRLGSASLPVGRIYEGHLNALQLIDLYGETSQKDRWFSAAIDEQKLFGVWNTQDQDGVSGLEIGNGNFLLKGSKTFCSGGNWVDHPLITFRLESPTAKGWQMCVIPSEKIRQIKVDTSFWKPLGMRASASFKMDFTDMVINKTDLLGPADAYYQQPHFSGGSIRFCAVQLGGAQAIFYETQQFLKELKRTEDTFQKTRIAEMAFLIETGNLWIAQSAVKMESLISNKSSEQKLLAYINMARTVIEEICIRCMTLSERSVGSRGLMRPNPLERIHRDLTTYLRQPAPDASLLSIGDYVFKQNPADNMWI